MGSQARTGFQARTVYHGIHLDTPYLQQYVQRASRSAQTRRLIFDSDILPFFEECTYCDILENATVDFEKGTSLCRLEWTNLVEDIDRKGTNFEFLHPKRRFIADAVDSLRSRSSKKS